MVQRESEGENSMKVCDVTGCRSAEEVQSIEIKGLFAEFSGKPFELELCRDCRSLPIGRDDLLKVINIVRRREHKGSSNA